jgi:hypothetical protein
VSGGVYQQGGGVFQQDGDLLNAVRRHLEILSNVVYRRRAHPFVEDQLSGLLGLFFAIDEADASNDLWDQFESFEAAPMLLGLQTEFKDHR